MRIPRDDECHSQMRRLLVGLTLVVLLAISAGIGILVAYWPQLSGKL